MIDLSRIQPLPHHVVRLPKWKVCQGKNDTLLIFPSYQQADPATGMAQGYMSGRLTQHGPWYICMGGFQHEAIKQVTGIRSLPASPEPSEPVSHSQRINHSLQVGIGVVPASQQRNIKGNQGG